MRRWLPPEFWGNVLRMLKEALPEDETEYAGIRHVRANFGVGYRACDAAEVASPVRDRYRPTAGCDLRRARGDQALQT